MEGRGGKCHTYRCDLTDREDVYAVAERVKAEVGTVDILINNAGIVSGSYFLDTPDSEFLHLKTQSRNIFISHILISCTFREDRTDLQSERLGPLLDHQVIPGRYDGEEERTHRLCRQCRGLHRVLQTLRLLQFKVRRRRSSRIVTVSSYFLDKLDINRVERKYLA